MFAKALFSAATVGTLACAQTSEQKEKYKEWSAIMGVWEYDWEPHQVVTDDGYTLTLMHVTKKSGPFHKKPDTKMAPMLVVAPMGSSPHSWLEAGLYPEDPKTPMILQLRDAGHDMWFNYSRGTVYSLKNDKYAADSKEFWDFSWEQMGTGDIKASLSYVFAATQQKVGLIGYSMGTTQIFAAMALEYENFYKDHTYKVVQLAPCTITEKSQYAPFNMATVHALEAFGIFELGGPTWYSTIVKIRKVLGLKGLQGFLAQGWGSTLKDISMKAFYHYAQNSKQNRFQRYSDSYWQPFGKSETELYDLSQFTETPFGFFFGALDTTCPVAQTEITKNEMGATIEAYKMYEGLDHGSLIMYDTEEFVQDILDFLKPGQTDHATSVAMMLQ